MGYIQGLEVEDDFINNVKKGIGYPVITEEFDSIYNNENIKDLVISPCLETFYNFFPKMDEIILSVSGGTEVEIDAPERMIGIIQYAFVDGVGGSNINLNSGNPFYTSSQTSLMYRGNSFGTPFSYGKNLYTYQNKFYAQSQMAMNKVYYAKFDHINRKIKLKSTISGSFTLRIGCYDPVVANIPWNLQRHFSTYCNGTLMVEFGNILSLSNADLPLEFNTEDIIERGRDKIDAEMEYFRENSIIPVMR